MHIVLYIYIFNEGIGEIVHLAIDLITFGEKPISTLNIHINYKSNPWFQKHKKMNKKGHHII